MKTRKNSGKTIKRVATIFFVLGIILAVLLAIAAIISGIFCFSIEETAAGIGLIVGGIVEAVIVAFLCWAATRTTYGIGEIVEFTAELTSYAEILTKQNGANTEVMPSFPQSPTPAPTYGRTPTPTPVPTPVPTPSPAQQPVRPASSSEVICPKCGKPQPAGLNYCRYCGQSMKD
ncbi:MAG: zinc ribbon domain-containing protein [Oscillospiraceae bacterium]|nr:zinc ribbon domain-containing protein [Oscillospiraceae bacterium]